MLRIHIPGVSQVVPDTFPGQYYTSRGKATLNKTKKSRDRNRLSSKRLSYYVIPALRVIQNVHMRVLSSALVIL